MEVPVINRIVQIYNETMEKADPRALDYPFMDSPGLNLIGTLLYIFIVTYAGPKYMKNRPAYNLRKFVVVYNLVMVAVSAFMVYEFAAAGWMTGYSLVCQECDYSEKGLRMLRVSYIFWFSKYIEFLDTFFFIAHKKFNHVSILHVTHHSLMAFTWWFGIKFAAGGLGTFHALINSFVHFVMYGYYAVAAMGPAYQKYLWWKKYLTAFQMAQFIAIFVHSTNIIIFHDCKYPTVFKYILASYGFLFFVLFSNFWIQVYTKRVFRKKVETNGYASGGDIVSNSIPKSNGTSLSNGVHKRIVANGNSKHH